MSDNISYKEIENEIENKLHLVIRRPQEGKTFICINSITNDISADIHIVLTMNTLSAGMQFFGRMEEKIGPKNIIVFNSDKNTAGDCHHAKTSNDVSKLLKKYPNIKVIVCCAHKKRFEKSLIEIFENANDSLQFKQQNHKFKLHIDEAHVYIPQNREDVRKFNKHEIVSKIIGYSASPDPIFSIDNSDSMFNNIYIIDLEKEFGMIHSNKYFGVKDCEGPRIIEQEIDITTLQNTDFDNIVPKHIIRFSLTEKEREKERETGIILNKNWYGTSTIFKCGNELLYFNYLNYILPSLVPQDTFSYNFVPAYIRKITHYQTAEIILNNYKDGNVIIINGNGIELFRYLKIGEVFILTKIKTKAQIRIKNEIHQKQLLEPSFVIETLITETDNRNKPTFITGSLCVGMSITLVSETLGHFDNVVMAHQHYNKEEIYQFCRFLFNYILWSSENELKIKSKPTKLNFLKREVYDICLDYETYIEKLTTEYAGKFCSLNEARDIEPSLPSDKVIRRADLDSISKYVKWEWKRFEIDGEDEEDTKIQFERAKRYYKNKKGTEITERSMPKPYEKDNTFLACTFSEKKERYLIDDIEKKIEGNKTWDSLFQLAPGITKYVTRMFIGYKNFEDCTKYTIYMKSAILEENSNVLDILEKYYGEKLEKQNIINDSCCSCIIEEK